MAAITQLRPWGIPGAAYGVWTDKTATAVVKAGLIGKKRKKRTFEFPNGIRVTASDYETARIIADWNPDGRESIAEPRREPAEKPKAKPATRAAKVPELPPEPPQRDYAAEFDAKVQDEIERKRLKAEARRKRDERDIAIILLLAA